VYTKNAKNKSGTVWLIINKKMGTTKSNKWGIKINWNSVEITHSRNITELCNSYFSRIPENLLKKRGDRRSDPQSSFQSKG
jgi:hypothetical protein